MSCVILSHLDKIKWLERGGKKITRDCLADTAVSTEKAKSDHFESRQQTAVLPASEDRFTMNTRTSMVSAGKSPAVSVLKRFWDVFKKFRVPPLYSSLREASGTLYLQGRNHPWNKIRKPCLPTSVKINITAMQRIFI